MEIVYVLGTTRSGTSAVRNAIAETRYHGYGEGHLIGILTEIVQYVKSAKRIGDNMNIPNVGLSSIHEMSMIRNLFGGYERYLVENLGSRFIVDKTPNIFPIQAAPDLLRYHGSAKFIYCIRRHIDNLESKRKKFPKESFEEQCKEWVACHQAWVDVKDKLGNSFVEVEHRSLVTATELITRSIASLLGLDDEDDYKMQQYLLNERPEATKEEKDLTAYLKLSDVDWSDEDIETFLMICESYGKNAGYGLETYFA